MHTPRCDGCEGSELHTTGDDLSDPLRRLDQMPVGMVSVARGGPVPAMAEQLGDQGGQILAGGNRHHGT